VAVPGEAPSPIEGGRLQTDLHLEEVATSWRGEVVCDPVTLRELVVKTVMSGGDTPPVDLGAAPYTSVCDVTVRGWVELMASVPGASGSEVLASWEVPVDLDLAVPIASGWTLHGVVYTPASTLYGDVGDAVRAIYGAVGDAVGWIVHRVKDAGEWALSQVRGLYEDMVESILAESAYTLSRSLWSIGDSLVQRRFNNAMNATWDLLMDLIGDDLRERLTWDLHVFGTDLEVAIDPTLQQLDLEVVGRVTKTSLSIRRLSEPNPPFRAKPVDGYHWGVFGNVVLDSRGSSATLHVDPLTLERSAILTLEAKWGGDGGTGTELVVQALEARRVTGSADIRLSDILEGAGLLSMGGIIGGIDAGIALHGDVLDPKAVKDLCLKAVKDAWLASVRGWSVGDLGGVTDAPPEAGVFLETLFKELHHALVRRGEAFVSEIEAFVEVDPPGPGWPELRLCLVISRPLEVLLPLQAWVSAALPRLLGTATAGSLEGAGAGLTASLAEHLLLRFELVWGVEVPRWVPGGDEVQAGGLVGLVVRGEANIASVGALVGMDIGRWGATLEVMIRGVPGAALAMVPGMGSPDWKWAELSLLKLAVRDTSVPRLLLSQVLYDAAGRDLDLEFLEIVNVGGRIVDLEGWELVDGSGTYTIRSRVPLLPGDHALVVRNATAVRLEWDVLADVDGMSLRLANDGDLVGLVAPDGTRVDEVAWEGYLEGWEGLETSEGEALLRFHGDLRAIEPGAWTAAMPSPRRTTW
jgi:hypothetical protein